MIITYSGRSKISARKIAAALVELDEDVTLNRGSTGDINWGRATADTKLNLDVSNSTNKRVMRELFAAEGVPMPKLIYSLNHNVLAAAFPVPCVGRPDYHSRGRGYWLCNSWEDVVKAKRGTRTKKAATHFMEFIEAEHELRVHIFMGKSIRISEKHFEGTEGCHRLYTTIKPTVELRAVRRAAKAAVKALGLDFGAVDVLVDKDGNPYVLEVNTAPGLGGSLPQLYAKCMLEWYHKQIESTNSGR